MNLTFWLLLTTAACVAAGLLCFRAGRRSGAAAARFAGRARPTRGTVVDLTSEPLMRQTSNDPGVNVSVFYPVVEFRTPNGQLLRTTTMTGARPAPAKKGQAVDLLYDPADPRRVELAGRSRHAMAPLYYVLGALFVVLGAMAAFFWFVMVVLLNFSV